MGCDVCIGISDYDCASVYNSAMVKARKAHKCCECRRVIQPGEQYERVAAIWDGSWSHYRTCALCREIRDVFRCGDGFLFETLWDEMRDYAFPELTTASECFTQLSAAAKERVLAEWRKWKGLVA